MEFFEYTVFRGRDQSSPYKFAISNKFILI